MRLKRRMSLQAAALTCAVLLSACPEESTVSSSGGEAPEAAPRNPPAPAGAAAGAEPANAVAPEAGAAGATAPAPEVAAAGTGEAASGDAAAPAGAAATGAPAEGVKPAAAPPDGQATAGAFKREIKGIQDQAALAKTGKTIHVKGMVLGDECKGKPNRIEAFVSQQTGIPPVTITQVFNTDIGHFEMLVPKQDKDMWIIAACDVDGDGQMSKKDAVACYASNPFRPTEDISGVVLKFIVGNAGDCGLPKPPTPKPGGAPGAAPPPPSAPGAGAAAPGGAPAAATAPAPASGPKAGTDAKEGATPKKKPAAGGE